jgi:hypothetical protein
MGGACSTYGRHEKVKDEVVPVRNSMQLQKDIWEGGGIAPRIFNLGTRWR